MKNTKLASASQFSNQSSATTSAQKTCSGNDIKMLTKNRNTIPEFNIRVIDEDEQREHPPFAGQEKGMGKT